MSPSFQLSLTARKAALLQGHRTTLQVLVRFVAPEPPKDLPPRPKLNLAFVLDRSGSMAGAPLQAAVGAVRQMVEELGSDDRVAIVSFDQEVRVDVPSRAARPADELLQALSGIRAGGTTALHAGWVRGAEQAAIGVEADRVSRVLLLTDGRANVGKTEPDQVASDVAKVAAKGIATTTYGLGQAFDEQLLGAMADAGRGGRYYGETPDDLMEPFRTELGLLAALCTRGVRLELDAPEGATVEVLNPYARDADGAWMLPDLAFGGDVWALVQVDAPETLPGEGEGGGALVLGARVVYADREGASGRTERVELRLPRVPAEAFQAIGEDPLVVRRAQEIRAARLQADIRAAADRGDWKAVARSIARARREAEDNGWIANVLDELEAIAAEKDARKLSKEAYYASHYLAAGQRDAAELGTDAAAGGFNLELEGTKPDYLRRKRAHGRSTARQSRGKIHRVPDATDPDTLLGEIIDGLSSKPDDGK